MKPLKIPISTGIYHHFLKRIAEQIKLLYSSHERNVVHIQGSCLNITLCAYMDYKV